jgi:hypothetical protein
MFKLCLKTESDTLAEEEEEEEEEEGEEEVDLL